jgi:putative chitobiose transport system substrate-binding protein
MAMRRRELLQLLAGGSAAAALAVSGCRQRPRGQVVEFWTLDLAPKFNGYIQGVIAAWEQQQPGWRVRWTDVPWASVERKLLAAVFARTAPDLVNLNPPFAANLASKGGLLDLASVLPAAASRAYLPAIWEAGRQDGQQFAIPWYLTARIAMANRRLLQGAGAVAPPRRWQELPAFAEAVRRRTGRYALFMTVVPDDSAELLETLVQMGVQLLDPQRQAAFDSPAGRRAFAFWTDLYRRGLLPREVVSQGYRRAIELYQSGDLALVATGPDFLRNLQTNAPGVAAVTAPFPPITGADGTANVAVMNLVVPKRSPVAAQAADFGLFLTNAANQLTFADEARVLPSATAALQQLQAGLRGQQAAPGADQLVQRARLLSAETLERARVLVPAMPGVKRLQAIVYTQLQRAMLGQVESDVALNVAATEWNRYAAARWPVSG